jgi:hypothetical protein
MIPISAIVQRKHHLPRSRPTAHKMIIFHPILMKDAGNVPDAGRESDAIVQGALTQVTDNFLSKIQTTINQEFVHINMPVHDFLHKRNLNILLQST